MTDSEKRFRALVEVSSEVLYTMSPDWTEMRQLHSEGFLAETKEPTNQWLEKYIHPDDQSYVLAAIGEAIQNKSIFELEHRVKREDGTWGYTFSRAIPLLNEQGEIEEWFGAASDVTERKRAEEELKRSKERLQRAFEIETVGVLFFDMESNFIDANDTFLRMIGYDRQVLERGELRSDRVSLPEWMPRTWQAFEELKATGRFSPYEKELIRPDGTRWWGLFAGARLGENEAVEFIINVTERKRAEEELKRSNKELEQFAYSVSHDLQEPLRSIVGFVQLLQLRYSDRLDEKGRQFIDRTVAAGQRMQTLINDLLSLSRVTINKEAFTSTDLKQLIKTVLENTESTIQDHNATIVCADLPTLSVDPSQIQSLFQNLIANGIKYNKSSAPRIEIDCQPYDHGYEFIVKDNGIGISPEFYGQIFQVFQRLHTTEEYEGTGIGLAKCKKIVENHGGRIWVESHSGEGSTFHFTLTL